MNKFLKNKKFLVLLAVVLVVVAIFIRVKNTNNPSKVDNIKADNIEVVKLPNMAVPRAGHSTIPLKDGRVLILGDVSSSNVVKIAEIFDPKTNKFYRISDTNFSHRSPKLFMMQNGKVLIIDFSGIEIFNPKTSKFERKYSDLLFNSQEACILKEQLSKKFTVNGSYSPYLFFMMSDALLLKNNKVFLDLGRYVKIYDMDKDVFSGTAKYLIVRGDERRVLLTDGKILVIGGLARKGFADEVESFNPKTNRFTIVGKIPFLKRIYKCILLKNGKIFILGSDTPTLIGSKSIIYYSNTVVIYDPKTNRSFIAGHTSMTKGHYDSVLLNDGKVLISEGYDIPSNSSFYEIYDPNTNKLKFYKASYLKRDMSQLTVLNNGNVLITGGIKTSLDSDLMPTSSAEIIAINK
ncbi:MAG: hypothetical protein A2039_07240 [Candidatus Melainabacteria bacterium GWA2_34_9]|nr:MAG: hypothetical protein A2039_07240 [Candidatus Melainabacteria bacterium GWA2_34_9]